MALHTITAIKRTRSSVNGNPAFVITFEDGTTARTQTDTSWAYEVDDSMIGRRFNFTMTSTGRIRYARKA